MIKILDLTLVFGLGILLGTFFFVGLWWTTQKLISSKHPMVLFSISLLLRMSVTLVGFYFIAHDHWFKLIVSLIGFLVARFFVMRFCTQDTSGSSSLIKEADHAS